MSEFSLGKNGKFGSIDFNKLKSGITAAQLGIKDGVLKSIFDKIDTIKDGSLDRSELQEFIRQVEELAQKDKKDNNLSLNEARKFQLDDKNIGKNKDELLNFLSKLADLTKGIKQVKEGANAENPSEIIEYENGKTEEIFKDGSKIITIKDGNKTTTTKYDEKGNQTEETVVDGDNVTITTFTNNKKSVSTTVNQASGKITEITYDENEEAKKKIEKEKNGTEKEFELNGETEVLKREKTEAGETVFDGDKKTITTEENGKKITTVYEGETLKTTETSYKNDENKTIVEKTTHNGQNKTTIISVDGVEKYQQKVIDGKEYFVEYDENGNTVGIIVQNGEGINAIAKKFGCTAQELIKANGSKVKGKYPNAYFLVGAEIKIPKKLEADHKALQGRKTRDEAIQGYKDFMAAKKAEEEARLAAEAAEAARIAEEARLAQEAQNNTTIQKESAKQIVADLKDAIKGLNDNDKIKEVLSRIDDPEEFKEVERLLAGEGYEADELYSVLEKFMYKELSESKISDNSFELLEQTVQKWIQSGVLKGDDAINAQARLAARIICDGGDGFGTDPDEIKRGIALIKSPTNNPADAKKVYAKVNDIIKNHKTFYGMGAESKDLVDYLEGELFDKEIIEHLGKLAENDALQGDERVEATANLVEAAVKGGGTREGRLTQAIKGVKTPEERAKLEAKLNEYCEQRGIERQYDGQSSIQAILYDECSHSEVRKYNEMMIAQGAYTTDEAVNLRAEQAMLQILEGNFGNIEEAVKEIKDPAVLAKLNTLIATQGFADLNDFLAKNLNETQANLINAELASKSLLSDEKSAEVALKLIQSTDFNQKAMGLKSIRNENTAKLVDTKLKESGSSLAKVYEQFNAEKATNKTLAAIWDGIAIFTGFISEGISDEHARNINMSDNLYVESQTKIDIPADKQAAYDLAVQDFAFRLEELKTSYESALDSQGLVSGLVNSIASRFNVGTTRDEIEARIAYDTESLRLFKLAKEGKLAKIVDGKPVAVSFEEIFKERQSGRISANLVKISTAKSADEITEFNAEKMTAVATQTQRMAVMSELKDLVFTSWQDLEEGIYSGDTKRLAVGIHNTLKMLSELKGERMSLDQYGYSLNSEGIIVDQSGNPVGALELRTVAMQLKQGLADIAKATFGVEINTNTDKNALKELLDKTFEEKIEAFKQEYEEAYGQRPTDEMVEKYIKTINTGKTILNIGTMIGAALLVPFTGGGSLAVFGAVAGASMGLNALEKSTDADGYTNLEWTSDAEQALWDGVLTAVGMKVGGIAEKFARGTIQTGTLGKLSAKTSEILAKSIKNPSTLNKVTTIVARAEALGFEVSSDALQSLVQMYCQEGEFNAEIFTRALVMSAIGNAAGHISAAAKDVKVDDVVRQYDEAGNLPHRVDTREVRNAIADNEKFVQVGKERIDIATADAEALARARKAVANWADGTRNKQELLDLIDERLNTIDVVPGARARSTEIVEGLNNLDNKHAVEILTGKTGVLSPENYAKLESHLINNLKTVDEVEDFIQQVRNRVGVDHNGNMHVMEVQGKDYGAMIVKKAEEQIGKIKARLADFNNVTDILDNASAAKKGLSGTELASVKNYVDKTNSVEELQDILARLDGVKKSNAKRILKKHIEERIETIKASTVQAQPKADVQAEAPVMPKADAVAAATPRVEVTAATKDVVCTANTPVKVGTDSTIRLANRVDIDMNDLQFKLDAMKDGDSFMIGRTVSGPNDIQINSPYVSGQHIKIEKINGEIYLTDLSSTNGTILNTTRPDYAAKWSPDMNNKHANASARDFSAQCNKYYDELRLADYSYESSVTSNISDADVDFFQQFEHASTSPMNGWSLRTPNRLKGKHFSAADRISLNVKADRNLLLELDRLLETGEYVNKQGQVVKINVPDGEYKTPSLLDGWTERHDPITMYFSEKVSGELEEAIAEITEKYARQSTNGKALMNSLDNKPWIAHESYITVEQAQALYQRAQSLSPELADGIAYWVDANGSWNCSTGMYAAAQRMVDEFQLSL